jgi:small ligand-binding sensory domain FIST
VRDRDTSAGDLVRCLREYHDRTAVPPAGALLFSSLGRGEVLYGESGHDSRVFRDIAGDVPLGGFFGNGELGPFGSSTFLHGHTSAFALFRPAAADG